MEQFDKVVGTFQPVQMDTLRPEAVAFIGQCITWQALWRIEDGPYEGDWAMQEVGALHFPYWVPSRDVVPVGG